LRIERRVEKVDEFPVKQNAVVWVM